MVELSLTALRLRDVLKWRTAFSESAASRTGRFEPCWEGVSEARTPAAAGRSEVSRLEKVAGPVMCRLRVVGLLPAARARRARVVAREDILVVVVVVLRCSWDVVWVGETKREVGRSGRRNKQLVVAVGARD